MKEMIMWDKYDNKYREVVDVEVARGLEADLYEANNRINDLLDIEKQKDKLINEMAKYIDDFQMECNKYYKDKEDVIKTFEERCKNAND